MSDAYKDNYGAVFGTTEVQRGSWVWSEALGCLVPRDQYTDTDTGDDCPTVLRQLDAFVSPVDGTVIDDRGKLREHNKRHGVTNVQDYGEGYFERRGKEKYAEQQGTTRAAKRDRIEAIRATMQKQGLL